MCFSAQASFIVGAATGIVGLAALDRMRSTPCQWLALVPCFFAIQQVSEGIVWLHLVGSFHATPLTWIAQGIYLTFALLFWPVYAPFAVMMSEPARPKRVLLSLALMAGILVSGYNLAQLAIGVGSPTVVGQSIHYGFGEGYFPMRIMYGVVALLPLLISSLRKMWILGTLALLGFAVADYQYNVAFTSVWCFFAATLSVVLYFILKDNEECVGQLTINRESRAR